MPKIKVVLSKEVIDGQPITFIAPCDCSEATGLKVSYPGGTKEFAFKDSHGNNLTGITELFLKDAYVRVIVDTVNGNAFIQNADTNAYIEDTFLKKAGGTMTGMVQFKPTNGTGVITAETYRNLPTSNPTASYKTRNVIASTGAAMQFFKGAVGEEPSTEVNRLTLTETDTQLMKPLNIASGGHGGKTAVEALDNLKALNIDHINDAAFVIPSGADLNDYVTPGAYSIRSASVAGSLINGPSYKSAGARLIVSATSHTSTGIIQFLVFNAISNQIWYRIESHTGSWGEWTKIGDTCMKILWTNASPSSIFAAQTITISDLSEYSAVIVNIHATEGSNRMDSILVTKKGHDGDSIRAQRIARDATGTVGVYELERIFKVSFGSGKVTFNDAYQNDNVTNTRQIPYEIIGIRGSM